LDIPVLISQFIVLPGENLGSRCEFGSFLETNGIPGLFVLPGLVDLVKDELLVVQIPLTEHNQILVVPFKQHFFGEVH